MRGTVTQFPVNRRDVSIPDNQKMIESLSRLSRDVDSFVKQTDLFTKKVAAVSAACEKARALMERF